MVLFSRRDWRDDLLDDVQHRLDGLRREAKSLGSGAGQSLSEGARDLSEGARELGEVVLEKGAKAGRRLGRKVLRAGKAAGRDPLPTVVALIGIAAIASLVLGDRRTAGR